MAYGQDSLGMSGVRSTFSDRSSDQVQVMLHRNNRLHGQLLPGAQRAAAELGADDTKPDMPDVQMTGYFSPHNTSGVLPLELNYMSNQLFTFAYTFLVRGNSHASTGTLAAYTVICWCWCCGIFSSLWCDACCAPTMLALLVAQAASSFVPFRS